MPLLIAVRSASHRQAFAIGYLCGLVHYVSLLYWIAYAVTHYGGVSTPAAILMLLLLAAYLAVYPACFSCFARLWLNSPGFWFGGLPALWVVLEWLRAHLLTGFPWAELGYSQSPVISFIQTADLWGVYGISWLVVCVNVCIAGSIMRMRSSLLVIIGVTCVIVLNDVYGYWRLSSIGRYRGRVHQVGLIQGNIGQSRKWNPEYQEATIHRYAELSRKSLMEYPATEFLVWPETAMPFFFRLDPAMSEKVRILIRCLGTPVLFGALDVISTPLGLKPQNKALLVDSGGEVIGQYAKRHLVPFGEYVPLKELMFFARKLMEATGDFVPGEDGRPLSLDGMKLGVLICYEAIFPELARDEVKRGAGLLVNITNDAWYGKTSGPYQHLQMARWRAIEFRVPMIRCANTGISAIIDSSGRWLGTLPLNVAGYLVAPVTVVPIKSFYACYGDIFVLICAFLTMLMMVFSLLKNLAGRR